MRMDHPNWKQPHHDEEDAAYKEPVLLPANDPSVQRADTLEENDVPEGDAAVDETQQQ